MSVVAGCSLFNGVLLAADCRVTVSRQGLSDICSDNVQKVFGVLPHTAVGFVGDVGTAAFMLYHLLIQAGRRKKSDPFDLLRWMPRFFRRTYADYNSKNRKKDPVYLMAASVEAGKPNIVNRKAVVDLVEDIGFGRTTIKRSWMPGMLFEFLKIDPRFEYVSLPGSSRGMLYVMRSPEFEPEHYSPLQFAAIGSGGQVVEEIHRYRDTVFAMFPGNSGMEGGHFRDAIQRFIREHNINSVGGICPTLKVTANGIEALGYGIEIPVGGTKIRLDYEGNRWVQRNVTTGKEITLLFPWEFNPDKIPKNMRFDDLDEVFKEFKGE